MDYAPPRSMKPAETHYCPGCGHGIAHRLICEVVDDLGIRERTLAVAPVGCAVLAYDYFNFDVTEAAHGRAPAVATGMKRCNPGMVVFTYQGDGDLAAIGAGEIVNAANRGELISVFFINNATYGMTGGQMAPTTLVGQKTTTSPAGRVATRDGWPMRVIEMLSQLSGTAYAERCILDTPAHIRAARTAIRHSFDMQIAGRGFSIVELLAACPVGWGLSPVVSISMMGPRMTPVFPLGVTKDIGLSPAPAVSQELAKTSGAPGALAPPTTTPCPSVEKISKPATEPTPEEEEEEAPSTAWSEIHINLLTGTSPAPTTESNNA